MTLPVGSGKLLAQIVRCLQKGMRVLRAYVAYGKGHRLEQVIICVAKLLGGYWPRRCVERNL